MRVFVKTLNGRTIAFEVGSTDLVDTLKNLISTKESIPPQQQRLVHSGRPLENGISLQESKVYDGATVHLLLNKKAGDTMRLFVKSLTGKTITVEVDTAASVAEVKEKITQLEGVPAHMQQLIFSGVSLADDRVLGTYNIQRESTIHLVVKVPAVPGKGARTGEVKPSTEQQSRPHSAQHSLPSDPHPIPAPRNYAAVSPQSGYPPEPLRHPPYQQFRNEPTHNIQQIQVFVNSVVGKQLTLITNPYNMVSAFKEEVAIKEGYAKDQLVLLFNGRNLPENRTLNDCGITNHSIIHIMLTPNQQRMHLFVKTLTGQTFILYPMSTMTVREVKEDIQRKEGIPVTQQNLVFEGQPLEDDRTLKDSRLPLQCTVHLINQAPAAQPLTILVRTLLGKTIALHINSGDSVRSVKRQIQEKEGYPPDQINLVFGGREMDDDATLTQYSVQQDSTLLVSFRTKNPLRLTVTVQSKDESINVDSLFPTDTLQALVGLLQQKLQSPSDSHQLVFNGKLLTGERSLGDYGLQDGSIIDLYSTKPSLVRLEISTVAGEHFTAQVSTSKTVRAVKTLLQEQTNVHSGEMVLMYNGAVMEDGKALSSYSLSQKASIWLSLLPFGQRNLTIMTQSGRTAVDIINRDTIGQLKIAIQRKQGTTAHLQDLQYNGKQLQDHYCIGDYAIPDRAVIRMSSHSSPLCLIYFTSSVDSSSFTLLANLTDSVAVLQLRVATRLGVPVDKVQLVYCGEVLNGTQPISHYEISSPSSLLILMN